MKSTKKFSKPRLSRIINGDIELPKPTTEQIIPKTRLDLALSTKYPQFNRSVIQKYIKAGQATINGKITTKPNTATTEADNLKINLKSTLAPPKIPTIYEDENVIVLDKPAGLLTISKGAFNPEPTLEQHGQIVHRLDRDTSGVIILAKNSATKTKLQKQFQSRKVYKTYYAITSKKPKLPHAIINIPIARDLKHPTQFKTDPTGREAITEYKVISTSNNRTLIKLKPQTGRTHQLRVHLAHIGAPILGDKIYGTTPANRMYLHAAQLEITIPEGQRKTFTAKLPKEFQNVPS